MKSVYQAWSGTIRFGNVAEERTERGWKYYRVDWVDDEPYERAALNFDPSYEWHRRDHVRFFNPEELIKTINRLE
tara:strand:- start:318 stop:542 length:225 start_codon:yes stop_codon:yes gene_type:complete